MDTKNNKNIFAANLKKLMALNNKSRRDVCNDLDLSYWTFCDWVNGKKYPRMDKVELLANYFSVLKSDLIEEKEKSTAADDGLSRDMLELIDCIRNLPEDKIQVLLQVAKSIR